MKNYTITIDILDAVYDFYPGLSTEDATRIADLIVDKWDYTGEYNKVADDITWYADALDIDLEGKDGYIEDEEPNRFDRDAGSIARQRLVNNNVHVLDPPTSPLFP